MTTSILNNIEGYEFSENQKNLWIIGDNNQAEFYNQIVLKSEKEISLDELLKAIKLVIEKNPVLSYKTYYNKNFTYPIQFENQQVEVDWHQTDASENEITDVIDTHLDYIYNPSVNEPVRFCFIKISGKIRYIGIRLYSLWGDNYSAKLLCDHISNAIDLSTAYLNDGTEKIDYSGYCAWQNELISQPEDDATLFWNSYAPQIGNKIIPFSHTAKNRFAVQKKQIYSTSGDDYAALKNFCKLHDTKPEAVLLYNFVSYLSRFTEKDITLGYLPFNRNYAELDNTLGLVNNVMPVIFQNMYGLSVQEAANNVEEQVAKVKDWSDYFTLDRENKIEGQDTTAFNYCFEFLDLTNPKQNTNKNFEIIGMESIQDTFGLKFSCIDYGDHIAIVLYFNKECFKNPEQDMIEVQLKAHLKSLTANKIIDSEISEIEQRIINDANATGKTFKKHNSIHELFDIQAGLYPNNIALVTDESEVSYSELNTRSNQFKNYLIEKYDVKQGDAICVLSSASEWFLVSILGIMKAGAYYIPVDKNYPEDRIRHILTESACKVLVCDSDVLGKYNFSEMEVIISSDGKIYDDTRENYTVTVHDQDIAYCIYTSGSTGTPKGCVISHANLLNYVQWANDFYFENPNSGNWGLVTSVSFDLSVTALFTSLTRGKKLWIGNSEKDINELLKEAFSRSDIDTLKLTPAHISLLKELDIKNTTVEIVICGGEQLLKHHVEILREINNDISIYNEYGPTEATVGCIVKEITNVDDEIVIGKPIANTTIYILNNSHKPSQIGVLGELFIGGLSLSQGYLNRADLTQEKFIENPFPVGGQLYKTGDLACWLPDGNIDYKGRKDDQVKIRGYRIELSEIEHIFSQLDFISQSVVVVKEKDADKYIVAYYVSETEVNKNKLKSALSKRLPDYMLPGYYVQLDKMPLTVNGKIDKKALLDVSDEDTITEEYVAPRTTEEKVLVSVWSDVLKRQQIGIKDSFYNLGGDSIKSIQIVSRLKQKGYALKIEQILRSPIIEDLAKLLTSNTKITDQSDVEGMVHLTPIQHYFFSNPDINCKNHFNQSVLLKSSIAIDSNLLERCIAELVIHHDALRMVYQQEGASWKQYNQGVSGTHYKITFHDLRGQADELTALKTLGEELQSCFDISSGSMFHVGHFRLSDGDRVALIIHHLVVDGISWRILLEDLSHLYASYKSGETFKLQLKTDSFQRWAFSQNEYSGQDTLASERLYWERVCNENVPALPNDKAYSASVINADSSKSFYLDKAFTEQLLTNVHEVYNSEINDILLTGLGLAVYDVFGVSKTAVHLEGHGREDIIDGIDIGRTVGWFTTIYPFILDVSTTDNQLENLVKVKESLRKVPNKGIGYGILKYLAEGFETILTPSILFNYLGDFGKNAGDLEHPVFEFATEDIGPNSSPENSEGVLLNISGMMVLGQLNITINYPCEAYEHDTIEQLAGSYQNHLQNLIKELSTTADRFITPSDLTFKGLDMSELLEINADNNVEDIYELSPLQQGIYYHWLREKSTTMYFIQTSYRLYSETLVIDQVKQAFDLLISRHAILRTSFTNNYGGVPLQIVHKRVPSNFTFKQVADSKDIQACTQEVKADDRSKGFDLETPSHLRLKVLDLGNGSYEFIWSNHHMVMDGWCLSILINDFYSLLNLIADKKAIDLVLPVKYSEYIDWLSKIKKADSLNFWQEYLADFSTVTEIPSKNSNATAYLFGEETLLISGDPYASMVSLCNELKVTHSTFIQVVWGYLLSRYNNTEDAVFGTVVSGRPGELPGVEDIVGLFSNTIPVRVRYEKATTPRELLKRVHEEGIESNPHHYLNLSEVQSQNELGMNLIDHIMIFENFPMEDLIKQNIEDGQGQKHHELAIDEVSVFDENNYDFSITIHPVASSLKIEFRYNANKYDGEFIKKLAGHFNTLVEQFGADADKSLNHYNYLSVQEQDQLLLRFNDNKVNFPKDKTIVNLFADQVNRTPDNVSLVFDTKSLTYREADDLSSQMAHCLRNEHQIKNGDLVGVQLNRSEWAIIAILAILKAGGVYVPIDPELPDQLKAFIAQDTQLKLLITETTYLFELDFYEGNVFAVDVEFEPLDFNVDFQDIEVKPNDLAYIIYTSGSTGQPKGVMIEHGGVVNTILSQIAMFDLHDHKKSLQFASLSFDASIWEIFLTLLSGSSLYIVNETDRKDAKLLEKYIVSNGIEMATLPPAYLKLMDVESLKGLNILITAGEVPVNDKVASYLPYGTFYNAYGPTEASICATIFKIEKGSTSEFVNIPIGIPIANAGIYILDSFLNPLPIGVVGQLYIGGPGLARGYLNRSELTSEKFVKNPFIDGEHIYDTGDLGKWLPNGNIEYAGRNDDQVKIRGHRIELGAIESRLSLYSNSIKQILVVVKEVNSEKTIVVYYVSEIEIDKSALRNYLLESLPEYMVPGFYVQIEAMPITSNGKIDRKALPSVNGEDAIKMEYEAPRNETEQKLAAIWQEILAIDKIGINDNFFELGGHSLMAIQLFNRMKLELGKNVAFPVFFENPTIKYLSTHLQDSKYIAIPKAPQSISYPLAASQQRLWVLSQLEEGSVAYNMLTSVKLTGFINVSKFEEAFRLLIDRHEVLRTYFKTNNEGEVRQYIVDKGVLDFRINEQDFSNETNKAASISKYLESDNSIPFDLEQAPLLRASMIHVSHDSHVFSLLMHHIIADGWSLELMVSEIIQLYNSLVKGKSIQLSELKVQYKDYTVWLNGEEIKEKHQASEKYWLDQLSGELPVLVLPSYKPRPLIQTYNGDHRSYEFSKTFLDKVRNFSKAQDVTMFMTLMTGVKIILHKYSNQTDLIVGTSIAGREHPDLENQVGLFLNLLTLRTVINPHDSFINLLKKEKETLLGAYQHQGYPFGELLEKLNIKRDRSRSVLFDVMIDLQNQEQLNNLNNRDALQDLIVESYNHEVKTSKFDLEFNFRETITGLLLNVGYNTDIYDANQITELFVHLEGLFIKVLNQPECLIHDITYLSSLEHDKVINEFNATDLDFPKNRTIVDLFEMQASATPDTVALFFEGKTLTYKELDIISNNLSCTLREDYGVRKGDFVGVQLYRSEWSVISFLGILKSGGVYVPVDHELPDDRKSFIFSDTGLKVLITETAFIFDLDFYDGPVFSLDVEFEPAQERAYEKQDIAADDLAYIIYTSGSTGNPKGVMIEHSGIANTITSQKDAIGMGDCKNSLQFASFSFDTSIWDIFNTLLSGSSLYILNEETRKDIKLFEAYVVENEIEIATLPPAFLKLLDISCLKNLKVLITAGESAIHDKVSEYLQYGTFYNSFGPTESSIACTGYKVEKGSTLSSANIPIGKPIDNVQVYVLDTFLNPCAIGVYGELYISGAGLARGYQNRPDLSSKSFVPNPFKEGMQMYKSGDLARWLPDGNLEYKGRLDTQVKIRGYRIELGEIEHIITEQEFISQAVVVITERRSEKYIVAYYVPEIDIDKKVIQENLRKVLPDYMLPTYYVRLDKIPLTSNGKIDRKALPCITEEDLIKNEYIAPSNRIEEVLTAIIANIVDCNSSEIGINDNFFDLGMNSLSLVKMIGLIKTELKIEVSISLLFEFPNVNQLSDKIFSLINSEEDHLLKSNEEDINLSQETEDFLEQIID